MEEREDFNSLSQFNIEPSIQSREFDLSETELYEEIDLIFSESPYKELKNKKIHKNLGIEIYNYIVGKLTPQKYPKIHIFIFICEYLKFNINFMFTRLSVRQKEELLAELNLEYGIFSKSKTKRLF